MMKMIKLAKKGIFIYNPFRDKSFCVVNLHCFYNGMEVLMFHMHNRKTKKMISSIIIILIVIAMFIPTLSYFIF